MINTALKWIFGIALSILTLLLLLCAPSPAPLRYGMDNCRNCRMLITDQRHGGELITKKGKILKFDSVECLVAYYLHNFKDLNNVHSLWVVDFQNPEQFIEAEHAWYLHSELLHSPMGLNLSAFGDVNITNRVQDMYAGEILDWKQVSQIVRENFIEKFSR